MPDPVPMRRPASPSALRNRRILVVEDEVVLAADLRRELEDAGAEVMGPVPTAAHARPPA